MVSCTDLTFRSTAFLGRGAQLASFGGGSQSTTRAGVRRRVRAARTVLSRDAADADTWVTCLNDARGALIRRPGRSAWRAKLF